MREIKFRVWDDVNESMIPWEEFKNIPYVKRNFLKDGVDDNLQHFMQYTGLLDKNGKEIYESDILEIDEEGRKMYDVVGSDGSGVAQRQIVGYKHGSWMTNRNPHQLGEENTYLWILLPSCEIIGNIYENQELIN